MKVVIVGGVAGGATAAARIRRLDEQAEIVVFERSGFISYAIFNATKFVCMWDPTFVAYLAKKRAEGKHYNVAISHAAKKLVRLIYAMERSGQPYKPAAI